jgi:tetratricopeptide (TPR) repeat protein
MYSFSFSFHKVIFTINQAARAHLISARELTAADNFSEAENEYRKSITLDSDDAEVIVEFAKFLTIKINKTWTGIRRKDRCEIFRLASYGEARCLFEAALRDDMSNRTRYSDADAYDELGDIACLEDLRKAITFYKEAVKSDPDHVANVNLLMLRKCRPWLFLPNDDDFDGDTQTPLFDEKVEFDILIEEYAKHTRYLESTR